MKLSPVQERTLLKMDQWRWYSATGLCCRKRTLSVLRDWNLIEQNYTTRLWRLTDYGIAHQKRLALAKNFNSPSGQE